MIAMFVPVALCRNSWFTDAQPFRPFLPQLIPVEVPELRAKEWLHSLLSGVAFIHQRGVVHNDIKCVFSLVQLQHAPRAHHVYAVN